jgi:hypothetical protein
LMTVDNRFTFRLFILDVFLSSEIHLRPHEKTSRHRVCSIIGKSDIFFS